MRPYRLTETRDNLVKIVAEKTKKCVSSYGSIIDYLCNNYMVIVNSDAPEFVYVDNDNGFVVSIQAYNEESVLKAVAGLKLFHYMIENSQVGDDLISRERELFLKYFNECSSYP